MERSLFRNEGLLSVKGACTIDKYTDRSPKDNFIVRDEVSEDHIDWGTVNQPIDVVLFDRLYKEIVAYLKK